jgi:hypothetical protein
MQAQVGGMAKWAEASGGGRFQRTHFCSEGGGLFGTLQWLRASWPWRARDIVRAGRKGGGGDQARRTRRLGRMGWLGQIDSGIKVRF